MSTQGHTELTVGHDDTNLGILYHSVSRGDVAALMAEVLLAQLS